MHTCIYVYIHAHLSSSIFYTHQNSNLDLTIFFGKGPVSDVSCLAARSRAPLPWSSRTARRPAPPSPARPRSCFNAQAGDLYLTFT